MKRDQDTVNQVIERLCELAAEYAPYDRRNGICADVMEALGGYGWEPWSLLKTAFIEMGLHGDYPLDDEQRHDGFHDLWEGERGESRRKLAFNTAVHLVEKYGYTGTKWGIH